MGPGRAIVRTRLETPGLVNSRPTYTGERIKLGPVGRNATLYVRREGGSTIPSVPESDRSPRSRVAVVVQVEIVAGLRNEDTLAREEDSECMSWTICR